MRRNIQSQTTLLQRYENANTIDKMAILSKALFQIGISGYSYGQLVILKDTNMAKYKRLEAKAKEYMKDCIV